MTEHGFITQVQTGKVKHPTQRGFTIEGWNQAYAGVRKPSTADESLHEAGTWFHTKFEKIRATLAEFGRLDIPHNQTVQIHVGAVNYFVHSLIRRHNQELTMLLGNKKIADSSGVEQEMGVTVQSAFEEQVEALVGSARLTVRAAMADSRKPEDSEECDVLKTLAKIQANLNLALSYDVLEYLWGECLWNGWYVVTREDIDVVAPSDWDFVRQCAVSERRKDELLWQLANLACIEWSRSSQEFRQLVVQGPRITGVTEDGHNKRFEVGPGDSSANTPPLEHISEIAAQELYFGTLLSQDLPNLPGLTLRALIKAWVVLAPLADILTERFLNREAVTELQQALEYCSVLDRVDLESVLTATLNFTEEQAKQVIELFTFSTNQRDDLWLTPFVPTVDGKLALVVQALKSPNLLRSVEQWTKRSGLDLGSRGDAFERLVRNDLTKSSRLDSFEVVQRSVQTVASDGEEEIDFVARLGKTIIIGECKCSVQPAEPVEFHNYFDTLRRAAGQAKRKAKFIENDLVAFLHTAGISGLDVQELRVIPVVITNLPLGVGHSFNGVPVTDILVFSRFVEEGEVEHEAYIDRSSGRTVARSKTVFYASEAEAERNLRAYLSEPPQIRNYERFVNIEVRPLLQMSEDHKPAGFVNVFVDTPSIMPLP